MENSITKIVLLGGGYVSVWAYRSLAKMLRKEINNSTVQITVVSPDDHHAFHGWTAENLTCIIQDDNRMSSLSEIMSRSTILKGKAEEINSSSNKVLVRLADGTSTNISYDHLLIGIGSFDSEHIEGICTYGYQVKSHEAFCRTKSAIQSIIEQASMADTQTAKKLLSFIVAGGGFAGVELVTNIAEYIRIIKKQHPSLHHINPTIRLINSSKQVLSVLKDYKKVINYTEKVMHDYNIEVIHNSRISKVTYDGAFLSDETFLSSSMVISTIGQSRCILKGTENMQRDSLNRIQTNSYLHIQNHSNIWGGGDACNVRNYTTGEACPSNALWAMKHGEYAGKNIARSIKRQTLKPFKYKGLGQCASLGIGKGIGEMYGVQFTGLIAWIMRWIIFNYFMPSRTTMLREINDWMYFFSHSKRRGLIAKSFNYQTRLA